jgi:octaprenyl-diphosphate synthase
LVGDFLLARALAIGAETGKLDVITVLADITGRMAQGEIHQLSKKGDICLTEAEYLDIIGNKTAVLIQGACRVGALIADAAAHQQKAVGTYGFHIGMAFQMVDDMLDYIAQTDCLGKTVGTDLREAKMTLPLIHLMARLAPQERQIVKEVMGKTDLPEDQFLAVVALMEKYNSLAYVRTCAEDHVARAKAALMGFDPSETRSLLLNVADYAIAREQ